MDVFLHHLKGVKSSTDMESQDVIETASAALSAIEGMENDEFYRRLLLSHCHRIVNSLIDQANYLPHPNEGGYFRPEKHCGIHTNPGDTGCRVCGRSFCE